MKLDRTRPPSPYEHLPEVPSFTVTSDDLVHGEKMALTHVVDTAGGGNESPHLEWHGFPAETRSFAVTCYDPDAPTGCGWWHWQVINIPADITELPRGAGDPDGDLLPRSAVQMRNDYGSFGFGGAGPPPGDHAHRYMFAVTALDVESLDLGPDTTPAVVGFHLTAHGLARGVIEVTYEH